MGEGKVRYIQPTYTQNTHTYTRPRAHAHAHSFNKFDIWLQMINRIYGIFTGVV